MKKYTKEELIEILEQHAQWLRDENDEGRANLRWADLSRANLHRADLSGANLSRADLSRANLSEANLHGADLRWANLHGADLRWADLSRADLHEADLSEANLSGADLSGADLSGADLSEANLANTCLDPQLTHHARAFARKCPAQHTGGRIVYRTERSKYVGNTRYHPGKTYIALNLSWSVETACHPGLYAGSLEYIRREYPNVQLVRCYVRDGDWTITAKGAIRCARLRVLSYVED